jgi:transmembrane sensor
MDGADDLKAAAAEASDWVVRLSAEPLEADWLAFEAWLQAGPARRGAYDRALSVWLELDGLDESALTPSPGPSEKARRPRSSSLWWSGAMMSLTALAVTFAALHPQKAGPPDIYVTAKGERREIALSDGTRVALNAGSSLSVRITRRAREATLTQGEAAFQVAHDARRPFLVQAGDRQLRDLGTDFDVRRSDGLLIVTVREGMVGVQTSDHDVRRLVLGPGMRLRRREGAAQSEITAADTEAAFSWRSGSLIYRARPLSEVAADLDRYGQAQVKAAGAAADLKFSGVLTIDNQDAMIKRLTELMPVVSTRTDGAIVLRALNTAD